MVRRDEVLERRPAKVGCLVVQGFVAGDCGECWLGAPSALATGAQGPVFSVGLVRLVAASDMAAHVQGRCFQKSGHSDVSDARTVI